MSYGLPWPLGPLAPWPPLARGSGAGAPSGFSPGTIATRQTDVVSRYDIPPATDRARRAALPTLLTAMERLRPGLDHTDGIVAALEGETGPEIRFGAEILQYSIPLFGARYGITGAYLGTLGDAFAGRAHRLPPALVNAINAPPGTIVPWGASAPVHSLASYANAIPSYVGGMRDAIERGLPLGAGSGPAISFRPIQPRVVEIVPPSSILLSPSVEMLTRAFAYSDASQVTRVGVIVVQGPSVYQIGLLQGRVDDRGVPAMTVVFVALATIVLAVITAGVGAALVGLAAAGGLAAAVAAGGIALIGYLERQANNFLLAIEADSSISAGDRTAVRNWTRSFFALATSDAEAGRLLPRED